MVESGELVPTATDRFLAAAPSVAGSAVASLSGVCAQTWKAPFVRSAGPKNLLLGGDEIVSAGGVESTGYMARVDCPSTPALLVQSASTV